MGLTTKIQAHPKGAAIALGVLLVLVIVLAVMAGSYRKKWKASTKGKFVSFLDPTIYRPCRAEKMSDSPPIVVGLSSCAAPAAWDPPAIAEAEGLGVLGALPSPSWGERRLRQAMKA